MIYRCKKCKAQKEILKASLILKDNKWVAKEVYCKKCNLYMMSEPEEGFPYLIRTEPSLKKNNG